VSDIADDTSSFALIEPMLSSRAALVKLHRKAICWVFFREVGTRFAANGNSEESLLACRLCRPAIADTDDWQSVRGPRGGLVRYSSATGTSAMRTHVRSVHSAVAISVERAIAVSENHDHPPALPLPQSQSHPQATQLPQQQPLLQASLQQPHTERHHA
jgi:hypothetical protein